MGSTQPLLSPSIILACGMLCIAGIPAVISSGMLSSLPSQWFACAVIDESDIMGMAACDAACICTGTASSKGPVLQALPGNLSDVVDGIRGQFPVSKSELRQELQAEQATIDALTRRVDQLTPVRVAAPTQAIIQLVKSWLASGRAISPQAPLCSLSCQVLQESGSMHPWGWQCNAFSIASDCLSARAAGGQKANADPLRHLQGYNGTNGTDGSTGPAGALQPNLG